MKAIEVLDDVDNYFIPSSFVCELVTLWKGNPLLPVRLPRDYYETIWQLMLAGF